jgi:phasin family protein
MAETKKTPRATKVKRPAATAAAPVSRASVADTKKTPKVAKMKPAAAARKVAPVRIETAEGRLTMKNDTTQAVTDRVQAIFGDVNEQARAALEKNAKIVEELTELTRGNVEALVASSKVAAKGVEALGQEAAEYGRKSFEEVSTAFRTFAEVKSPTDLFKLQSEFAKSQFDSIVAESSKLSEAVIKLASEVFEPLSTRYSVASEKVKSVVAA